MADEPKPPAQKGSGQLTVLAVDDSALVRQVLREILSRQRGLEVITAADPLIAETKMKKERPDVILLDLDLPRMDGLTFLRRLMATDPIPVVICSGYAGEGSQNALRALELGAVDIIEKPRVGVEEFLQESEVTIVDAIRAAAQARVRRPGQQPRKRSTVVATPKLTADALLAPPRPRAVRATDRVVAIGASTGGTDAIKVILQRLPPDSPGLVIVQHMPERFTKAFADLLGGQCQIEVREAADGDVLHRGRALLAPGNRHLLLQRSGRKYFARLRDGPLVSRHRPSIDVLFRSVAQAAGSNALGILLTGMGDDGATGLWEMRQTGAHTVAQNEASCVVFGMPKEAIRRGAADQVLSLTAIASAICSS